MKKHLRYLLTLLLVMVASVGWAEETLYQFQSKSWTAVLGDNVTAANWTSGKDGNSYAAGQGVQITTGVSGANATSPISFSNVTRIVVTYNTNKSKGNGTIKVQVGDNSEKSLAVAYPGGGVDGTSANFTAIFDNIDNESGNVKLTINCTTNSIYIKSIAITCEEGSSTAATTSVTIDNTGITNTDIFAGTAAGQLTATVKDDEDTAIEGATVTWTSSKESVATIAADGTVTLVAEGTTTLTASYAGVEDVYKSSSATYELTVTNNDPNKPGSLNNPYTVAQALANTPASGKSADVYVRGIVSGFYSSTITGDGSNYRYYISDDGTTTSQMMVYKGKGLNEAPFTNANDLLVGDTVVVLGKLTTYNSTKEIADGNHIISLGRPVTTDPSITVAPASVNAQATETEGSLTINYDNLDITGASDFEVKFYEDADATKETTFDWVIAEVEASGDAYVVNYVIEANSDVTDRTAYLKVWASGDVSSNLVTITQAGFEGLNFTWNLSIDETATASETEMSWNNTYAMMLVEKEGASTATNNYYPGSTTPRTSTRFYTDSKLTIAPKGGYKITKVEFTATSANYASALNGSSWTNATATVDNKLVTVVPTDGTAAMSAIISGTCGFDGVKVYYEKESGITVTIGETEYATLYYSNVGLIVPEGVTANAYSVSGTTLNVVQTYNAGDVIPAATGVVLNGAQGDYTFNITEENGTAAEGNMLRGSDVDKTTTDGAKYYMLSLNADSDPSSIGFYYGATDGAAFMNGAHKAYLAVPEGTEAKATGYAFNEVTGINDITREQVTDGVWYTIDGKRLNGEPTVKGIYVVNGKKVVIK